MTAGEVGRQITELSDRLSTLADGSREQRTTRVDLAVALAARYVQRDGPDADRIRATELCELVQADLESTVEERDRMSQLAATLTMVGRTPAAALRAHPVPDLDAVRRTMAWMGQTGPDGLLAGITEMRDRLTAVTGLDSLPPEIRAVFDLMPALADLLGSGAATPSESTVAQLNAVLDRTSQTANPAIELLRSMMPMIAPAPEPPVQADRLQQQLAILPETTC